VGLVYLSLKLRRSLRTLIGKSKAAKYNSQDCYQDSKAAAIEQRAAQSPSESSASAIKASPVLSEDAKLATTAGYIETNTARADWRDITGNHKHVENDLDLRVLRIRDTFSTMLGLACSYPGKMSLPRIEPHKLIRVNGRISIYHN
jgi:hypothetical protein